MDIDTPVQTCSKCGETKPVTLYDKDSSRKCGYHSQCKTCRRALPRKSRAKTPTLTPTVPAKSKKKSEPKLEGSGLVRNGSQPRQAPASRTPSQIERDKKNSEANREAILRLIDRHRSEYDRLVYSERIRKGLIQPGDIAPSGTWVSAN